jgi:CRISPR/Cas system-associated exonuclease Cas4 (RecB family)
MATYQRAKPAPGHPIRRDGKAYLWVTWVAKLLGGQQCLWSAWFKGHYAYTKFEEEAANLVEWNRDHNRLMRDRRLELERDGWLVTAEDQNSFKLQGESAVLAGKPDLIARKDDQILVVDGKTGRERDSDVWQVFLYLFALPRCREDITPGPGLAGEVHYQKGDRRVPVPFRDLTPKRTNDLVSLIKVLGASTAPSKAPSREECRRCNISAADCPERVSEHQEPELAILTDEF